MKTVTVFMSTYNGEKYLKEQIDSILNQKNVKVTLLVRDDGSHDATVDILKWYQKKGMLEFVEGENIGYGKSFLYLFRTVKKHSDYYAYADQDDIWDENKLYMAVKYLESISCKKGKLYFSNLNIVDEKNNFIRLKTFDHLKITLGSVYVRQRIAGCTMVFDNILFHLADRMKFDKYSYHISHEWIYLLCLAVGGKVYYDRNSYIRYRRHNDAVTSIGNGIGRRIQNELKPFGSAKNDKLELSKLILEMYLDQIKPDQIDLIKNIAEYKENPFNRLALMFNTSLKSGNFFYNIKNRICILFGVF